MRPPICIALLFTAAAIATSAGAADDKSSRWMRVQSLQLGGSMAAPPGSTLGWIEIQGWDWEAPPSGVFKGEISTIEPTYESATKIDGFNVKQSTKPIRRVGTSDMTMKRGTSPAAPPPPPPPPREPDGFLDYDEGDTGTHAMPPKSGRVKVQFHWADCVKGARLPSLELKDGRALYLLEDVTVARCTANGATFSYAKASRRPI